MKVYPREHRFHPYSSVSQGLVFLCKGEYYMKTSVAILSENRLPNQHNYYGRTRLSCVRIKDGKLCEFDETEQVIEFPDAAISPGREE